MANNRAMHQKDLLRQVNKAARARFTRKKRGWRRAVKKTEKKTRTVMQEELILSQDESNPKLNEIMIRVDDIQERINGSLQAHANGFRYTTNRDDHIDILYDNIKHAFFQPCDKEMIIRLHFHLKNSVTWGEKKCKDIQFYTNGGTNIELGRDHWDHWGDICTQQERETKVRFDNMFQTFCENVSNLCEVQFDSPISRIDFLGTSYRSVTNFMATDTCLISLTKWPPFIVFISDVEFVSLERVDKSPNANFDMVFIFKNYRRRPQLINNIPMSSLENIKRWLNSSNIWFCERYFSTNWPYLMKVVTDDFSGFFASGGWNFLISMPRKTKTSNKLSKYDNTGNAYALPESPVTGE